MRSISEQKALALSTADNVQLLKAPSLPRYLHDDSAGKLFIALEKLKTDLGAYLEALEDPSKVRGDLRSILGMWEYPKEGRTRLSSIKGFSDKKIGRRLCDYLHDALIYCKQNGVADTGVSVQIVKTAAFLRNCAGGEVGRSWPQSRGYGNLLASSYAFGELFDNVRTNVKEWREFMEENFSGLTRKEILAGIEAIGSWPSDSVVTLLSCLSKSGPKRRDILLQAAARLHAIRDEISPEDRQLLAESLSELLGKKKSSEHEELRRNLAALIMKGAKSPEYIAALEPLQGASTPLPLTDSK